MGQRLGISPRLRMAANIPSNQDAAIARLDLSSMYVEMLSKSPTACGESSTRKAMFFPQLRLSLV